MKVIVKMLHGKETEVEVSEKTSGLDLKNIISKDLNAEKGSVFTLVFKGKTISDETALSTLGISEGAKIHLMVKKSVKESKETIPSVSKVPDLFVKLETLLRQHLSAEESAKVVKEFKKNYDTMIDSMNFDDMERFAASNFTEF